jgi:hypothetical protein
MSGKSRLLTIMNMNTGVIAESRYMGPMKLLLPP